MSKIELQDFVQFGRLFEVYGGLLSNDRQKIMTDYFQFNMTLAEIAKERSISRQAVLDAVDKSCQKLKEYEQILGVCVKTENLKQKLMKLQAETSGEIKEKVEEILKEI
ncbi:MAG: RNA polymerase subunit sigma-70 [Clostridia bacterium]|nr:RNA polymerase subunit sigma-70 [Clostridia bacterium]